MRGISRDAGGTMRVVGDLADPIFLGEEAKRMVEEMVEAESSGRRDKLVAVAYRLQTKYRVPASIILQCWQRPPREMLVSRWMAVFQAYCRYESRRDRIDQRHPALGRLADAVAGHMAGSQAGGPDHG